MTICGQQGVAWEGLQERRENERRGFFECEACTRSPRSYARYVFVWIAEEPA